MSDFNLGTVTAYGYAKDKGYTGTEDEYAELMASYADVATQAAESATQAAASATTATTKAGEASTSASNAATSASTASTAATTATTKAGEASTSASTASTKASEATTAAATATTKAGEASTSATSAAGSATTASTAATTATTKASEAAASATAAAQSAASLVIDDTLTHAGQAADAKKTGDEIGDLKDGLTAIESDVTDLKQDLGNFEYSITKNNDWHNVDIAGTYATGDVLYIKTYAYDNCVAYIQLFFTDSTSSTLYSNETTGKEYWVTCPANVSYVRVSYKTSSVVSGTFTAIVVNTSAVNAFGYITAIKKAVEDNKADADSAITTIDSPFSVEIDSKFAGIVAFQFINNTSLNAQYKVTNIYYKDAFYFYMPVQVYRSGSWVAYDAIEILLANAPTETALTVVTSKYGNFRVAFVPSLMTAGRVTSVNYLIKNTAVEPFQIDLQSQVTALDTQQQYGDYELMDEIKTVIHVNADGTGDYTTIAAAYAAITDSSYDNQYEVIVHDGTYEEYNLICPPYTHTHGMNIGATIVTSENGTGTSPVFDQKSYPSKLSNMTIISGTGYCIHNDYNFINTGAVYNENLYCKKVYGTDVTNFGWKTQTNKDIIGAGAQYKGVKIVYNNCTFENGLVTCHSNSATTAEGNYHLVLKNCKVVNAWVQLQMAGSSGAATEGHWVCELDGLVAPVGCPSLVTYIGARTDDETYFKWQIIGGNNKNFAVVLNNVLDTLTTDIPWECINTNEKVYVQVTEAVTTGQWIDDTYAVCDANASVHDVLGVVLADGASGSTVPVWVGNAYSYTGSGEYGIGSDGTLSSSATTKIGKVVGNILYRY